MAYASVEDYEAQYPAASCSEDWLGTLLQQASDAIDMAFVMRGLSTPDADGGELLLRLACRVACQLAKREVDAQASELPADATQASWSAGVYSHSYTLTGSAGNLRLNAADLAALGLAGGAAGFSGGGADA